MKNYIPLSELMKQPLSKQINAIANLFIKNCLDESEVRKKPFLSTLIPLKKFFSKQDVENIHLLYDYLFSLKEPMIQDLSTAFRNASAYQQKLRLANDKAKQPEVEQYQDYKECLKELMNTEDNR